MNNKPPQTYIKAIEAEYSDTEIRLSLHRKIVQEIAIKNKVKKLIKQTNRKQRGGNTYE